MIPHTQMFTIHYLALQTNNTTHQYLNKPISISTKINITIHNNITIHQISLHTLILLHTNITTHHYQYEPISLQISLYSNITTHKNYYTTGNSNSPWEYLVNTSWIFPTPFWVTKAMASWISNRICPRKHITFFPHPILGHHSNGIVNFGSP